MDFEYISRTQRGKGVDQELWEDEFEGCSCVSGCSSEIELPCSCLVLGKDNYTEEGILLASDNTTPILECHSQCDCWLNGCRNRIVQEGVVVKLKVFRTDNKGLGVRCLEPIKKGKFICEYASECIGEDEVNRRREVYTGKPNYTMTLKERNSEKSWSTFLDARLRGNIGRLINHSCDPNLKVVILRVGRPTPIAAFFALRDIQPDEELAYDYGETLSPTNVHSKPCLCGATNCRKYLPMSISSTD